MYLFIYTLLAYTHYRLDQPDPSHYFVGRNPHSRSYSGEDGSFHHNRSIIQREKFKGPKSFFFLTTIENPVRVFFHDIVVILKAVRLKNKSTHMQLHLLRKKTYLLLHRQMMMIQAITSTSLHWFGPWIPIKWDNGLSGFYSGVRIPR